MINRYRLTPQGPLGRLRVMIEVILNKYTVESQDRAVVLVDADDAILVATDDEKSADSLLILNKGADEVAWFKDWIYAVKVDNLMEYVDE